MKVILGPTRDTESTKPTLLGDVNFFSMVQCVNKTKDSGTVFLVVGQAGVGWLGGASCDEP